MVPEGVAEMAQEITSLPEGHLRNHGNIEPPRVIFTVAGAMTPQTARLSAEMPTVHRSSPQPTHWGATECCQGPHLRPLS